jgi:single-strand DNA-binding protein
MARGVNKVILLGTLGQDPDTRFTPNQVAVTNFSIATNESYKDKQGEQIEKVTWHNIVAFNRLGEICAEYLRKGSQVYIEGKLQVDDWTDKDGNKRKTTKILANEMQMLGSRASGSNSAPSSMEGSPSSNVSAPKPQSSDDFDDDIPF